MCEIFSHFLTFQPRHCQYFFNQPKHFLDEKSTNQRVMHERSTGVERWGSRSSLGGFPLDEYTQEGLDLSATTPQPVASPMELRAKDKVVYE